MAIFIYLRAYQMCPKDTFLEQMFTPKVNSIPVILSHVFTKNTFVCTGTHTVV